MKGYIYKLSTDNLCYYGSTIQKVNNRLNSHIYKCKIHNQDPSRQRFTTAFDIVKYGRNNFLCEIIEEIDFIDKNELLQRERFYIENNTCINKTIPLQTRREWYNKNKDLIKEKRIKKFKETGKW